MLAREGIGAGDGQECLGWCSQDMGTDGTCAVRWWVEPRE